MNKLHIPVLLSEVLDVTQPQPGENYLDLTAGYAGHASKILDLTQNYKGSTLVDRDEFATEYLRGKYKSEPVEIVNKDFYSSVLDMVECGKTFDTILADFGVSSPQLDRAERGFSFQHNGPLDMRMDKAQELDAAKVINRYTERELTEVFVKYGEEKLGNARRMARLIVQNRPFETTGELAEFIRSKSKYSRNHPATKIFQAVRIEVNDELGLIEKTLPLIPKVLKSGGRVAIITFHSLEDRLVKNWMKEASSHGEESELEIMNKTPIVAGESELLSNPRARSAKLRVAKRR